MAVEVREVSKAFRGQAAVRNVSFSVAAGELLVLLGPSGSGKSTLLRMIAGLVGVDAGRILIDGREVTRLTPQQRELGFVFQHFALFEHMSVQQNISFALRVRGAAEPERRERAETLMELVGLQGLGQRSPLELSGGQRQRVALARALAHQPRLLLLDEPFGALDARIRHELRRSLKDIQRQLGTTMIFVTHDQEEAMAVADRLAVLNRGRLVEIGRPEELYLRPVTEFVASFLGNANLLPGFLTARGPVPALHGEAGDERNVPKRVKLMARPEDMVLEPERRSSHGVYLGPGRVVDTEFLGASERVRVNLCDEAGEPVAGLSVEALRVGQAALHEPLTLGETVHVSASRLHGLTEPNLRVLLVLNDEPGSDRLLKSARELVLNCQADLTVVADLDEASGLKGRLEPLRREVGTDLKLIARGQRQQSLAAIAREVLDARAHDLLLCRLNPEPGKDWIDLLRHGTLGGVLAVYGDADPEQPTLFGEGRPGWLALPQYSGGRSADLVLLTELAAQARAQVRLGLPLRQSNAGLEKAALGSAATIALSLRHVPFGTLDYDPEPLPNLKALVREHDRLVALDIGPRSLISAERLKSIFGQGAVLRRRWLLLLPRADAEDQRLGLEIDSLTHA